MECNCEMWKENYPKLDTMVILGHSYGIVYDGVFFNYCPWCGKEGVPTKRAAYVLWTCKECGNTKNYEKYDTCFACGHPRS